MKKQFLSAVRQPYIIKTLLFSLLLIFLYLFNLTVNPPMDGRIDPDALTVHYIDVGQGDAILLQMPTGENMLIDAGTNDSENVLLAYLDNVGVRVLDYAIFSHPHEDHVGGADRILDAYAVRKVILPDVKTASSTYERMFDGIRENGVDPIFAAVGDVYSLGEASFTILGPVSVDDDNLNNASVMLRLDYRDIAFLFTGDAEQEAEMAALAELEYTMFDADILKVGHHGSATASSDAFLEAVSPEVAVISCGKNNDYSHPHNAVLDALEQQEAKIYRTDTVGTVRICTDGTQYRIDTERQNDTP